MPLSAVLLHRTGLRYFTDFLEMEFSGENLQFWHEVRTYSSITQDQRRWAEAQRMFDTYISAKGVCLSCALSFDLSLPFLLCFVDHSLPPHPPSL